jgi:hypothetical protein
MIKTFLSYVPIVIFLIFLSLVSWAEYLVLQPTPTMFPSASPTAALTSTLSSTTPRSTYTVTVTTSVKTADTPSVTPTLVPSPTPTKVPRIDKVEVYMKGKDANERILLIPGETQNVSVGQKVVLEAEIVDSIGKRYTYDELLCVWEVEPLGEDDKPIMSDNCQALYTPSQEYLSQIVTIQQVGAQAQHFASGSFEPQDFIFNITQ